MRGFLRRFRRSSPTKASPLGTPASDSPECIGRQSLFRRSSSNFDNLMLKVFVPTKKPQCEETTESNRGRKRDRLRGYLSKRRTNKGKDRMPYLWPVNVPESDDVRSSGDTEEGDDDDMYVVDYYSDSDSDDESLCGDGYVTPPVAVPEMYRRQDRLGGVTVAGARILFTYSGFKRRQLLMRKLQGIPEDNQIDLPSGLQREYIVIGDEF